MIRSILARGIGPVLFAVFTLCLASVTMAQSKIAYVDASRLIDEAPQSAAAMTRLDNDFSQRSQTLRSDMEDYRWQRSEFENNQFSMTASDAEQKIRELQILQRNLERNQINYESDYTDARNRALADFEATVSRVIIDYAKRNNIDLVVQESVYASHRIVITDEILQELIRLHN